MLKLNSPGCVICYVALHQHDLSACMAGTLCYVKIKRQMWITKPIYFRTKMKEIRTKITVNANLGHVWNILIGIRYYSEWNPLIHFVRVIMVTAYLIIYPSCLFSFLPRFLLHHGRNGVNIFLKRSIYL